MKNENNILDEIIHVNDDIELRVFNLEDAAPFFSLIDKNRQYLKQWFPWVDNTNSVEDEARFIEAGISDRKTRKAFGYGIYFKGQIVGAIGYYEIAWEHKKAKIFYWLTEILQGKGIITESCRALVDFGFRKMDFNRIEIQVAPENKKSRAIPQRLGLKLEGVLRQNDKVGDKFYDSEVYGILKNERK